jgi:hypothetical protein
LFVTYLGSPLRAFALTEIDRRLAQYMEVLFLSGEPAAVARYALYGVAFSLEVVMRDASVFALAKKTLKGFTRKAPEASRDPPPIELMWLLAAFLLRLLPGELGGLAAGLVVIAFDGYLRPGEALALRKEDVYRSTKKGSTLLSVVVAPLSRGAPAKNKQFDDGYAVGAHGRSIATQLLQAIVDRTAVKEFLFPGVTLALWEKWCRAFVAEYKVTMTPHCLRHGGPSHDMYFHQASVQDVQWRGRWLAVESCRRYAKPAKMLRQRAALTPRQLVEAEEAAKNVGAQVLARLGRELRNNGDLLPEQHVRARTAAHQIIGPRRTARKRRCSLSS